MNDSGSCHDGRHVGERPRSRGSTALVGITALLALCVLTGCPGTGAVPDGNIGSVTKTATGEPNDTFAEALEVAYDSSGIGRIQGSIYPSDDVDVYNLGPMQPGDRIRVDLDGRNGLDAAIAIFDEAGLLFIENDDRDYELGLIDPLVNQVVRHSGAAYYLAVAAAPLSPGVGTYSATVVVSRGEPVPPPNPQAILLDFDGGTIHIPGDRTYVVGPFNTADIDPAYTGLTALVKQSIIATIRENFAGLALDLYNTDSRRPPAGLNCSTVYFGGSSPTAFGISQTIDPYNEIPTDSSIVFTDNFTPAQFGRYLTAEELGRAIGNIASHEIGHLLGLNHVANPQDLMDTVGSPITFLLDQMFMTSELDWRIWPFGLQDAPLLLSETLGSAP